MRRPSPRGSRSDRSRKWVIPPAILRDPDELLDGVPLLEEHSDVPELGLLLWELARDVVLWSEALDPARIFWPGSGDRILREQGVMALAPDTDLAYWINSLVEAVRQPADNAARTRVAELCVRIARWMLAHAHPETSLVFAQSGSLSNPADPVPALETARVAAALGKLVRAETWLHRTVGIARRAKAWLPYGAAYVELGRLSERRGDAAQARERYLLAARVGRRCSLPRVRGEAALALLRLALSDRNIEDGRRYARVASRSLPDEHPGRLTLHRDLAELWLRTGEPARAATLLRRLLVDMTDPGQRMYALALLASAAVPTGAAPGQLPQTWGEAWLLTTLHPRSPLRPRTLRELAETAERAGDRRRAAQASEALRSATARRPEDCGPVDEFQAPWEAGRWGS